MSDEQPHGRFLELLLLQSLELQQWQPLTHQIWRLWKMQLWKELKPWRKKQQQRQ